MSLVLDLFKVFVPVDINDNQKLLGETAGSFINSFYHQRSLFYSNLFLYLTHLHDV